MGSPQAMHQAAGIAVAAQAVDDLRGGMAAPGDDDGVLHARVPLFARHFILARRCAAGSVDDGSRRQEQGAELGLVLGLAALARDALQRAARGRFARRLDGRRHDVADGHLVGDGRDPVRGHGARPARDPAAARRGVRRRPRRGLRQHHAVPDPRRLPARPRNGALQPAPAHRLRDRRARRRQPAGAGARDDVRDGLHQHVGAEHLDHADDAAGRVVRRHHRVAGRRSRRPRRRELRQGDRARRRLRGDDRRPRHDRRHRDQRAGRRVHAAELRRDHQLHRVARLRHPDRAAADAGRLGSAGEGGVPVPDGFPGHGARRAHRRAHRARSDDDGGAARYGRLRRDGDRAGSPVRCSASSRASPNSTTRPSACWPGSRCSSRRAARRPAAPC